MVSVTYQYPVSQALFKRAAAVIPGGIYGHMSPAPLVPPTAYPFYVSRAEGCKFWDVDGNTFIDYMCAYGPMILGYHHPDVDAAAIKQMALSDCTMCPSPVMVELAEYLVDLISVADWAFFAKNGTDVTHYAVMVARSATGRKKIVMVEGAYHGVAPWMQAPGHHGVTEEDHRNIIRIPWNDQRALERAAADNPGQIAGLISLPYLHREFGDNELPEEGYWKGIEALCRKEGIVLIMDDVRCGFRLHLQGSNEYFGFKPDLACYSKAMANGYPISALVGSDSLKREASRVFYTGSFWFQAVPMAAALACLKELKRLDAPGVLMERGKTLLDGMIRIAKGYGYTLKASGVASMPYLRITDDESLMLHQRWCAECTKRGAYFTPHHNWFLSIAHGNTEIQRTWDIVDDAFKAIKKKIG